MKQKILALILTFCLLCSICSTALAASNDYAPPEITSVSMNAPGATVAAGDTLYFHMNVTDESTISSAYLSFELYDANGEYITVAVHGWIPTIRKPVWPPSSLKLLKECRVEYGNYLMFLQTIFTETVAIFIAVMKTAILTLITAGSLWQEHRKIL